MSLQQALQYLASGGAVALGAAFVSWASENWPWFQQQSAGVKQLFMVGVCLALSLGAWAVQTYVPAATLAQLAAPFGIAAATVAALLVNQAWHQLVNRANPEPPPGATIVVPTSSPAASGH